MKRVICTCCVVLLLLVTETGCKSINQVQETPQTTTDNNETQNVEPIQANQPDPVAQASEAVAPEVKLTVTPPKRLKLTDLKPITQKVHVDDEMGDAKATEPKADMLPAVYNNTNGEEDDLSIYVEGKGYFSGNAELFNLALLNPDLSGPLAVTKNMTVDELQTTPDGSSYIIHAGKGNDFEKVVNLGVTIDNIYDDNDKIIGYRYHSQKLDGDDAIQKADTDISIYQFGPVQSLIEYRSVYQSPLITSDNARLGLSTLFEHWNAVSEKYVKDFFQEKAAQDPQKCKKWGNNPLFIDGQILVYDISENHNNQNEDDPLLEDQETNYSILCKVSLIQAEPKFCVSEMKCFDSKGEETDIYNNFAHFDYSLAGYWRIDSKGLYQDAKGTTPIIAFRKDMDKVDEDEHFTTSLSVTHEGTSWERTDSVSGPDDFSQSITFDEAKGITEFTTSFAGGSESETIATLSGAFPAFK